MLTNGDLWSRFIETQSCLYLEQNDNRKQSYILFILQRASGEGDTTQQMAHLTAEGKGVFRPPQQTQLNNLYVEFVCGLCNEILDLHCVMLSVWTLL